MNYKEEKKLFLDYLDRSLFKYFNPEHFETKFYSSDGPKEDIDYFTELQVFYNNPDSDGITLIFKLYHSDKKIFFSGDFIPNFAKAILNLYPEMKTSCLVL